MSAYQYPAMPPAYAGAPSDPTAVMGRRIGAWIIDFLLWLLLGAFLGPTPLSPFAEYVDTNDFPSVECDDIERVNDLSACTEIGDRLYFVEGGEAGIAFVVAWIVAPLAYAAVQGATGRSPGKALFGVRAVDEFGNPPRFGKSLVRTLLWVVDGIPCIIPLVGFVTGLTSNGHRRVGDMAAKTFVVGKDHSGPVIVAGLATAATQGYPGAGYGAPGQQWGAPPPGPPGAPGQPQPWGAPPPGAPSGPPTGSWDQPSGGFPVPGAAPTGVPGGPGGPAGAGPSDRAAPPSGWAPPGVTPAPGTSGGPGAPPPTSRPGGPSPAPSTTGERSAATPASGRDTAAPGSGAAGWGAAREDDDGGGTDEATEPGAGAARADTTPGTGVTTGAGTAWTAGTTASSTTPPADATPGPDTTPSADAGAAAAEATSAETGPAPSTPEAGGVTSAATGPSDTDTAATSTSQAAPSSYNPQWDAARGTYIVWEPNRGKWLGWDESAQEWKPL